MSLETLLCDLNSQPDIDKCVLIKIIHNLVERINKLESKKNNSITIDIPSPNESYQKYISLIQIPKIEKYLDNLPNLLNQILTNWLNRENIPIILHNQSQIYIYTTYWKPFVNHDLTNLYNYIVKQITIQLSKWQTEQQDNIVQNEKLYEKYSKFILNILSHQPKKIKFIKETIKKLLIKDTPF